MSEPVISYVSWSGRNLPSGVNITEDDGVISGTPTIPGKYDSQITVKTDWGSSTEVVNITVYGLKITNNNTNPITFNETRESSYTFICAYALTEAEDDGNPPYWTISTLPSGLTTSNPSAKNFTISGRPTTKTTTTLTVSVSKGNYSDTKDFTLQIVEKTGSIEITTTSLPYGVKNEDYSATLSVNNTTGSSPFFYFSGLPSGLSGTQSTENSCACEYPLPKNSRINAVNITFKTFISI